MSQKRGRVAKRGGVSHVHLKPTPPQEPLLYHRLWTKIKTHRNSAVVHCGPLECSPQGEKCPLVKFHDPLPHFLLFRLILIHFSAHFRVISPPLFCPTLNDFLEDFLRFLVHFPISRIFRLIWHQWQTGKLANEI